MERRILGWPRHYSDSAQEGEIFLEKARYLSDTGETKDDVVVAGPGILLTKAAGISHIEVLDLETPLKEGSDEQEEQTAD